MFSSSSFNFLKQITINNNKKWFLENKDQYQSHLIEPCKDLVEKLRLFILLLDENLETTPVINKSLTSIYRDLRFSKNKIPFKNRIGINFRKKTSEWKKYPAFFFRIDPSGYYFGLMIMKNDSDHFDILRKEIDSNPKTFRKTIKKIKNNPNLHLRGENYKKYSYQGKDKDISQYYCKKNLYISCFRDSSHFNSYEEMVLEIRETFEDLSQLYLYLNDIFLKKERKH